MDLISVEMTEEIVSEPGNGAIEIIQGEEQRAKK